MELRGSFTAMATPFRDGKFDAAAFRDLVEFQIENAASGLVPCGTTGESATMTHAEHIEVIQCCVEAAGGRVPVIAGTGSNSTVEAIALTEAARQIGADAALLITPYYNKPTQEGLHDHYCAIAQAVDIPLIVYNCPGRTGVSIEPETLARLARIPGIVAVKDATGDPDWTTEVAQSCDLTILSGDDARTLPLMVLGAMGVISVTANVAPRQSAELVGLALEGRWTEARRAHEAIYKLGKLMFIESNPIPIKAALEMMGKIGPEIRPPLTPLRESNRTVLGQEMTRLGLLTKLAAV